MIGLSHSLLFPGGDIHPLVAGLSALVAVVTDGDGRGLAANSGFRRLAGEDRAAPVAPLFANPRFAELLAVLPGHDDDGDAPIFIGILTLLDRDGSPHSFGGAVFRQGDGIACIGEPDAGEHERLLASVLDLNGELADKQRALLRANRELETERARQADLVRQLTDAREQLMQAERLDAIGQLAAGVAHEINNPVGALVSNLGTLDAYAHDLLRLARQVATDQRADVDVDWLAEDLPQVVADMGEGLARVRRIVDALRDLARPGESRHQAIDLARSLEDAVVLMGDKLAAARIERELPALPAVDCVPAQIGQVFLVLLDNARRAIAGGGMLRLTAGSDASGVWIAIADDGCGIPPRDLPHLFEPFFTTRPVGAGTGLGLYVAWHIVRRHGGVIEVDSAPGRGSRFVVRLPFLPPNPLPISS